MKKFRDHQRVRNNPQQRLILGIFIIIVGVLALVDNLGLFDTQRFLSFWPTIFIILGVLKISQARKASGYIFGSLLLGAGTLLTLQNLGYLYIHWRDWWPVLIIAVGLSYMFKSTNTKSTIDDGNFYGDVNNKQVAPLNSDSDSIEIVSIMSGSKTNSGTPNFVGGEITTIMGSAEVDLRNASIQNEATIQVFVVMGNIEIWVPNDWIVVLNGAPILGGIEDHSVPPMNSTKRLVISGVVIMGGVEIKN